MKKILLAFVATSISTMFCINFARSQKASTKIIYNSPENPPAATFGNTAAVNTAEVKEKALKDFRKSFTTASQEKWFKVKGGYTAEFSDITATYRVDYDQRGNWTGTVKTYAEKNMPRDVRTVVKSMYFDYTIIWIKEITVPEFSVEPVYFIHIEDEKSFKNLSVYQGELKIMEEFKKG